MHPNFLDVYMSNIALFIGLILLLGLSYLTYVNDLFYIMILVLLISPALNVLVAMIIFVLSKRLLDLVFQVIGFFFSNSGN